MTEPVTDEAVTDLEYVSISKAATALAVSEKTIRRWIDAGELPHVKYGKTVRIPKSALEPQTAEEAS